MINFNINRYIANNTPWYKFWIEKQEPKIIYNMENFEIVNLSEFLIRIRYTWGIVINQPSESKKKLIFKYLCRQLEKLIQKSNYIPEIIMMIPRHAWTDYNKYSTFIDDFGSPPTTNKNLFKEPYVEWCEKYCKSKFTFWDTHEFIFFENKSDAALFLLTWKTNKYD